MLVTHLAAGDTAVTQTNLAPVMSKLFKPRLQARQQLGALHFPAYGIFHSAHAAGTVVPQTQLAPAHRWEPCTCPSLCLEHPSPTPPAAT